MSDINENLPDTRLLSAGLICLDQNLIYAIIIINSQHIISVG